MSDAYTKLAKIVEDDEVREASPQAAISSNSAVYAANKLTALWCAQLSTKDYAVSAAGVWPLLALLASAADEPAGAELTTALGCRADSALGDALELLDVLRASSSTKAALGIWTGKETPLRVDWVAKLPEGVVGELTDPAALDQWAAAQTGGLIDKFPLEVTADTEMVLASALAARVRWRAPFGSHPRVLGVAEDDPAQQWLHRTTSDLSVAAVLDASVTRVVVDGDGDVDIHLLLGDQQPAEVLAAGVRELSGEASVRLAADLDSAYGAPGLSVRLEHSTSSEDTFCLRLPSFDINSRHDLLMHRDLFGLRSVTDPEESHLPLMSPAPLYVASGAQDVVARFFAEGFEAAAVAAFEVECTGGPPPTPYQVKEVDASFDRPFGFLAVHRPSRLVVVAGWVSSPFQQSEIDPAV